MVHIELGFWDRNISHASSGFHQRFVIPCRCCGCRRTRRRRATQTWCTWTPKRIPTWRRCRRATSSPCPARPSAPLHSRCDLHLEAGLPAACRRCNDHAACTSSPAETHMQRAAVAAGCRRSAAKMFCNTRQLVAEWRHASGNARHHPSGRAAVGGAAASTRASLSAKPQPVMSSGSEGTVPANVT